MASRTYFWHYILNEEGQPIENAQVRFYLNNNPTIEANIYLTETSSLYTTCSISDVKTDNDGFFGFWLSNQSEAGGYSLSQEFILEWFKAGTKPGQINNINPWPNALEWEDTNIGADKNSKNKFVSDFYVNKWLTHTTQIIPSASPHDLYPVDYESGCDNNRFNKVVNNKILNDIVVVWGTEQSEAISGSSLLEYQEDITSWTPSGDIYYKDVNHSINKYITVQIAKLDDKRKVEPERIINDINSTRIFMSSEIDLRVTIQGEFGSSSSSQSSSSFSISSSSISISSSSSSSGIHPSGGLFIASDVGGTVTLNDSPLLVDSDRYTQAETQQIETDVSYGFYQNGPTRTTMFDVWCAVSGTSIVQNNFVNPTNTNRFTVSTSEDNNTWSNYPFYGVTGLPVSSYPYIPIVSSTANSFCFRVIFDCNGTPPIPSATYYKFRSLSDIETSGSSGPNGVLIPSEIELVGEGQQFMSNQDGWIVPLVYINDYTLSNNDRTILQGTAGGAIYVTPSKWFVSRGKWYWEIVWDVLGVTMYNAFSTVMSNSFLASNSNAWGLQRSGGLTRKANGASNTVVTPNMTAGDVAMYAVDSINGMCWVGRNGTWYESGNPVTLANPAYTNIHTGNNIYAQQSSWSPAQVTSRFKASQMSYGPPTGFSAPVAN